MIAVGRAARRTRKLFAVALLWLSGLVLTGFAVAETPGAMPKLDATWASAGVSPFGVSAARKVLLLPNGGAIFVGQSCTGPAASCTEIRKLTPSGTTDPVFRGGDTLVFPAIAYGSNYPIDAFLCDSNQNVLLVGGSSGRLFLAKFSATTGQLVPTFASSGTATHALGGLSTTTTPVAAMLTKDETAVVVSGNVSAATGAIALQFLVRIDATSGLVDLAFGDQGFAQTHGAIYALSPVGADKKFVAGGSAGAFAAIYQFSEVSGKLDTLFGTGGMTTFRLGTDTAAGRSDRIVDIVEIPNDSRLAVATIRTNPLSVVGFTLFTNVVRLALFDRTSNSIQSSFAVGAGFVEPANFTETGLDIAAPHPHIVVNAQTGRLYLSADVDGYVRYAGFNLDGTTDIEFGNAGALDAYLISQMSPPSNPSSTSWPLAVNANSMTIGGVRPVRLRLATCDADIDGDGLIAATTDGVSLLGAMLTLPIGLDRVGAARPTAKAQRDYARLLVGSNVLDVDGDGTVNAETDGLLVLRKLLGFKGPAITNGISFPPNAIRRSPVDIENFLASACALP